MKCEIGYGTEANLLIDSGADINVISEDDWDKLKRDFDDGKSTIFDVDYEPKMTVSAYASTTALEVKCSFKAWVDTSARSKPRAFTTFHVIRGGRRSLLGRETARAMKLLTIGLEVNTVVEPEPVEFPSVPDVLVDFDIDVSVPPKRHQYVSIPIHYRKPALARLRIMEKQGIIERVLSAPRWISGMSAVPKGKNDFRLVVNMRGPNRAIRRQYHRMPRIDEMRVELNGSRWFTKLDLTSAFHHLKLSEESRELTTFMAPDGMYRFTRMVFGVNCAPEIFQRTMEGILRDIDGVIVYIDDILVHAETEEQLKERTERVKAALLRNNLTINEGKCEYEKTSLTFLGHRLSAEGFSVDEAKVSDIKNFRQPKSSPEVKSFIGLATYVSAYIPHFSDLTRPLREVSSGSFKWGAEQQTSFEQTKEAIVSCTTTQGFFDVMHKTFLYTDASPYGLGAVLVQRNESGVDRIISFASKTLTETEKRYAQTQREALAVVWAAEHFHYYLLGQKFTIRTDAQGIACIFDRDREAPKRVLRRAEGWAMRLDSFDYEIEFVKGKENIADSPSRLSEKPAEEYDENESPCEIATIDCSAPVEIEFDDDYLPPLQVAQETAKDEEMIALSQALRTGQWPTELNAYKTFEEELHESDGIIMRTGLAVIPKNLRFKAMTLAHKGHPGETKMKSRMRSRVWWPKMDSAIVEWVQSCKACLLTGQREPPTPMERTRMPEAPWDLVAVDFCGPYASLGGISVLVMLDYYSRFMIAAPVRSTDFLSTEQRFVEIFDTYGIPGQIKSDNGPPFNGGEYKLFCDRRGIKPVHSWPLNPQQNGMAERAMRTVGKAIAIASFEGIDFKQALSETLKAYNSSSHRVTNVIPTEVMFGRRLRDSLPLTRPTLVELDHEGIKERDWNEKMKSKEREDGKRGARASRIEVGDRVVIRRDSTKKGQTPYDPEEFEVTENRNGDLTMQGPRGNTMRRNQTKVKRVVERPRSPRTAQAQTPTAAVEMRPQRTITRPSRYVDYLQELRGLNCNI